LSQINRRIRKTKNKKRFTMSGYPNADLAAAVTAGVEAGDLLMEGKEAREDADKNADLHLIMMAIGAALAIGAVEMMHKPNKNDGGAQEHLQDHHHDEEHLGHNDNRSQSQNENGAPSPKRHHHRVRDVIDTALAYRLGRKIMGKEHHGIVLIIAETVGALGLPHDTGHNTNAGGSMG
jgi:hypothetical protein